MHFHAIIVHSGDCNSSKHYSLIRFSASSTHSAKEIALEWAQRKVKEFGCIEHKCEGILEEYHSHMTHFSMDDVDYENLNVDRKLPLDDFLKTYEREMQNFYKEKDPHFRPYFFAYYEKQMKEFFEQNSPKKKMQTHLSLEVPVH